MKLRPGAKRHDLRARSTEQPYGDAARMGPGTLDRQEDKARWPTQRRAPRFVVMGARSSPASTPRRAPSPCSAAAACTSTEKA